MAFIRLIAPVVCVSVILAGAPFGASSEDSAWRPEALGGVEEEEATTLSSHATTGFSTLFSDVVRGGVVAAGVGLRNQGKGLIDLALPEGATVDRAYLYWVHLAATDPGNAATFNNQEIEGELIGGGVGVQDLCWGASYSWARRAEVTGLIDGLGNYKVTVPSGSTSGEDPWSFSPQPLAEGASLVAVYRLDSSEPREVIITDGYAPLVGSSLTLEIPRPISVRGPGHLVVVGADGQTNFAESMTLHGGLLASNSWDGSDLNGFAATFSRGNLWDTDKFSVTFPAAAPVALTIQSHGDCIGPTAFVIDAPGPLWGFDSSGEKITEKNYLKFSEKYGQPDFWGRYIGPKWGWDKQLEPKELETATKHGIEIVPVYFNYNERLVTTGDQGAQYAREAIEYSQRTLRIPQDVAIFVDIEDVKTTKDFILGWFDTFNSDFEYTVKEGKDSTTYAYQRGHYKAGFYGKTNPGSSFSTAYCEALGERPSLGANSFIWSWSLPRLLVSDSTTRANAPEWSPTEFSCGDAAAPATVAWQYAVENRDDPRGLDLNQATGLLPLWHLADR